jgi:hypothetical protein
MESGHVQSVKHRELPEETNMAIQHGNRCAFSSELNLPLIGDFPATFDDTGGSREDLIR